MAAAVTADVTVVIPTIPGREGLLHRAVASVRAQTVQSAQIITVADGDRRGAADARNRGLAQVRTHWVAWLDDDDRLLPRHLEVLVDAAEASGADLVYSYPVFVGAARDPLAVAHQGRWVSPFGVPFGPEQERHLRYQGNFIPISYLARAGLIRQVGGFPPSGGPGREEDYLLLLRLLDAGARFHHAPERTWEYHVWSGNTGGGSPGTGASNREAFR